MRRLSIVASVTLLTCFSTTLVFAQHAGGGHSGGGATSHVSSGYTGISRGAGASSFHTGAIAPTGPTPIGLQTYYSGYTGINPGAIRSGGRNIGRGYVPFLGYPYYVSTFDDYSQPSYYNNIGQDPNEQTAQVTANLLGEQINRLSSEVAQMRAQTYAAPPPVPYRLPAGEAGDSPSAEPQQNDPPITLVMTNGNKLTLQSYAVMNGNFWDFSRQPARKIPISSVDLAASEKATEAGGAEFPAIR